jgi:hypothetical protein
MLDNSLPSLLISKVQLGVSKQCIWSLGNNSNKSINLVAKLFIPPSDNNFLCFNLSFEIDSYNPILSITSVKDGIQDNEATISLNKEDLLVSFENLVDNLIVKHDNKADKNFELKLRRIILSSAVIENITYFPFKDRLFKVDDFI